MALGVTMQLPVDDKHNYTRDYLETRLAILMGGRVAEEIFLNQMTTGAGNDIERATDLARKMVCEFGMSELGPLTFGKKEEQIFLGREISQHRDFCEDTAMKIDAEVRTLRERGLHTARRRFSIEHRDATGTDCRWHCWNAKSSTPAEIQLLIEGKQLPAKVLPSSGDDQGNVQHVLKPEPGQRPGLAPGERPSPA